MRNTNKRRLPFMLALAIGILVLAACQPVTPPSVSVADQAIQDNTVTVAEVVSSGPGWIVIHTQADGKPGPIVGYAPVSGGMNQNVTVEVDSAAATDTLYAMLHTDGGAVGTWEFPGGPDTPVSIGGKVITPPFNLAAAESSAAMPDASSASLMVAGDDALGEFLVDGAGMTLYMFTKDEPGVSNCYDQCAQRWPPLLLEGDVQLGDGVDAALVGATERTDGTMQVTYNGWPLYYWFEDVAPGDTLGQNVGEVWFVITPAGEIVQ